MAKAAAALPFSIANFKKLEEIKKARTKQEQSDLQLLLET